MHNYYKYLPTSPEDESWGLHILNCGYNCVKSNEEYPSRKHPSHHYFNWDKGRITDEYQIVYISKGSGVFESVNYGRQEVNEGAIIILFPGEWHRYKPHAATGWDEFWVGMKGAIMDNLIKKLFFKKENAVVEIGLQENIIRLFTEIIEKAKEEKTGYQPCISGMLLHLLGEVHSLTRERGFECENITERIVKKARILFRNNFDNNITIEKVAEELNVSYAWFRKAFKKYTGIAPHQYLIQLKIEKAKSYLTDTTTPIKEIASTLNFESSFYFSRIFKNKVGVSPDLYRKSMKRNIVTHKPKFA